MLFEIYEYEMRIENSRTSSPNYQIFFAEMSLNSIWRWKLYEEYDKLLSLSLPSS